MRIAQNGQSVTLNFYSLNAFLKSFDGVDYSSGNYHNMCSTALRHLALNSQVLRPELLTLSYNTHCATGIVQRIKKGNE